jgi:hypothetical protein
VLEALHEKALHEKALHEKALREPGEGTALTEVSSEHLTRALDDLLDSAQEVTRTLLGVGVNPEDLPSGGMLDAAAMRNPGRVMMMRQAMVARRFRG